MNNIFKAQSQAVSNNDDVEITSSSEDEEEEVQDEREISLMLSRWLLEELVNSWLDKHALELMQEKFTIQAKTPKKKRMIDVFGSEDKNGKKIKFDD